MAKSKHLLLLMRLPVVRDVCVSLGGKEGVKARPALLGSLRRMVCVCVNLSLH